MFAGMLAGLHEKSRAHRLLVVQAREATVGLRWQPLVQLWIAAALLLFIAAVAFVTTGYHSAFHTINGWSTHIPEVLLHNLTVFGDGTFTLALVLLFANRNPRLHWVVFITAILGAIVSHLGKELFDAARPPAALAADTFNLFGPIYRHHSFPSGHTLTAFLLASIVFYYARSHWQKLGLLIAASLVGLSRVWLGVHWPVDALVGGALGIICGTLGIIIGYRWQAGVNPVMHRVILTLLVIAALLLLTTKNDYRLALPILYITGIAALWKTLRNYLLPQPHLTEVFLTDSAIKLPLCNHRVGAQTLFWVFLALVVGYRFLVLLQPHFSLFYDEAYYFHWSLNPDLGYYSKPPMVGWCIWLSTALLGNSVPAIKCMANLLYAASAVVVYITVRRYSTASNALIGGVIFITVPMIGFNSEFITTDAPLLFFWSLALYYSLKAIDTHRLSDWVWLGVFTGAGMLSKYTMGALPLAVFLYLLVSKQQRPLLASYGPWLAAAVAGLIFGLNIYWNYANHWVALRHTQEISQTSGKLFHLDALLEFVAAQFFIFGAVSSYLLFRGIRAYRKRPTPTAPLKPQQFNLLLWVMLTLLVAISVQAFLARAFPNWAGPWVIAGSVLLALTWQQAFSNKRFYKLFCYSLCSNLILLSMFYHWPTMLRWLDIEPNRKNDPFHRVAGWPQLGQELKPLLAPYPEARLTSDSRDLLAYLGYYATPGSFHFARWNPDANNIRDYYDLEVNLRNWQGDAQQTYIFVSRKPLGKSVKRRFLEVTPLAKISSQVYADQTLHVYVSYARGFIGYE